MKPSLAIVIVAILWLSGLALGYFIGQESQKNFRLDNEDALKAQVDSLNKKCGGKK